MDYTDQDPKLHQTYTAFVYKGQKWYIIYMYQPIPQCF